MSKKEFITEEHKKRRDTFRALGLIILGVGVLFFIIAVVNMFTITPFDDGPNYFWLGFIGVPLVGVGSYLCSLGFSGKVAEYQSREMAPVVKDVINYLAEEKQEGTETILHTAQKGNSTVVSAKLCSHCNELNKMDAKFCNECGKPL